MEHIKPTTMWTIPPILVVFDCSTPYLDYYVNLSWYIVFTTTLRSFIDRHIWMLTECGKCVHVNKDFINSDWKPPYWNIFAIVSNSHPQLPTPSIFIIHTTTAPCTAIHWREQKLGPWHRITIGKSMLIRGNAATFADQYWLEALAT
jgi:hypothetical protein